MATNTEPATSLSALRARLDDVGLADRRKLRRRIDDAQKVRDAARRADRAVEIAASFAKAERRLEQRRQGVPPITYPEQLPVSQRRDEIAAAIRDHQVVIVAGETGSGKTTQLPKICLELGRGVRGMIGHTQPRRLAARTVADRISEELGTDLGQTVGYAVRFTDRVGDATLVKLMTDGILLTDIHRDRELSAYDTLIIDEAHERSLNIDFILGYLKQLLPRRPDLKVIVTSATIDPERFSKHFDDAPIIEVSGRTFPVEQRYRPLVQDADEEDDEREPDRPVRDQLQGVCDAILELRGEKPGDILVFFSGEREIRDAAEVIRRMDLRDTEVLPLYSRLSAAEQHRVFASHTGRRIVLATNVAETSLTVPGIRYVIDPGTARVSRYSHRLKVQRLPIEPISQASANQRAGRCGRVAPGICIRLYDEEDFLSRPEFTEPEILRTNLASVILQMTWLGLGNISAFPFVEPPDRRAITDGVRLLQELGALDADATTAEGEHHRLTPIGRRLARLPVDPRFARMVLEANERDCLREVLIIAAALSIEDPRERPLEKAQAADQFHARFKEDDSDFLALLNLWQYTREQQRALSSNQFRRLCRREFLNYLRIREWQDVHSQLKRVAAELGMRQTTTAGDPARPDDVHRSLLAGLLSHIGMRDRETREFRGARQSKFAIFPGSALAKKPPTWVMAAELVETSRLWARTAARIQPEWAEDLAPHLTKHSYTEPHWSTKRGAAMAFESVSLYGLPIVTRRLVAYSQIDPEHARELFIRHALVEGDWKAHHRFLQQNRDALAEVEALEQRFRRTDLLVDDDSLYHLYDERIPANVVSQRHFESWWKKARRKDPELLTFTTDMLLSEAAASLDATAFPDQWHQGPLTFAVTYTFDPGAGFASGSAIGQVDGVSIHIPLPLLNQVRDVGFDWQVPGLREDRVIALMRSLPKVARRNLVPIPDNAKLVLDRLAEGPGDDGPPSEPLVDVLRRELTRLGGDPIARDDFDLSKVPEHLSVTFVVEDDDGRPLADGKDLDALKRLVAPDVRATIAEAAADAGIERSGARTWTFGTLPRRVSLSRHGQTVISYPALVDEGESVGIRVFDNDVEQHEAMWAGTRRLLRLTVPVPARAVKRRLVDQTKLAIAANPYPTVGALVEDCVVAILDAVMAEHGAPVWDAEAFASLQAAIRPDLERVATDLAAVMDKILTTTWRIDRRLREPVGERLIPAYDDMTEQRAALVHNGFVAQVGAERLPAVLRYLDGILVRLDAVEASPSRDRDRLQQVQRAQVAYNGLIDKVGVGTGYDVELERIGWMIEELRVSLFAQQLGTPEPISVKRVLNAVAAVTG
jgi:ATP-dependent helicase HrpA